MLELKTKGREMLVERTRAGELVCGSVMIKRMRKTTSTKTKYMLTSLNVYSVNTLTVVNERFIP